MQKAAKAEWQAQNAVSQAKNARAQAENANAALSNRIAQLERERQEESRRLEAWHVQETEQLRMTIQRHKNDQRRLETEIRALGERAESNLESNLELRRQLASTMETLQVTQQCLYEKQNEQIEQQQAIDDARDRGIAELQRSLLKPLPAGQQDLSQSSNHQALPNPADAGQQNLFEFPNSNQQGYRVTPMMGQTPNSYSPPMSQPNGSYGQDTQYGQSTMSEPQYQPSQGGA